MTLTRLGSGRLLSMMARSASLILFAAARALATPPTSGDTIARLLTLLNFLLISLITSPTENKLSSGMSKNP